MKRKTSKKSPARQAKSPTGMPGSGRRGKPVKPAKRTARKGAPASAAFSGTPAYGGAPSRGLSPTSARFGRTYEVAIPDRTDIAREVGAEPGITFGMLAQRLGVDRSQSEGFGRRVDAMLRDGDLLMKAGGRLHAGRQRERETGVVSRHRDGFGFVAPQGGGDDLFVPPSALEGIMHGDTVAFVRKAADWRGRQEARIVEVVERAVSRVVGKLRRDGKQWQVVPRDRNFSHAVALDGRPEGASEDDVVTATITHYPQGGIGARGSVTEILGNENDSGIEIEIALRKFDLPHAFSATAAAEANALPEQLRKSDLKDRTDITALPLVTIDGEDARDFDDAVYCEPKGRNFRLVVAIADVSHYVVPGKPLDVDARERSTSIYFPRRVIPMLPEKLSNGLCSLNPDVDRLVMVCDMVITAKGRITDYSFYPGVMHSQARFTYTEVAAILAEPDGEVAARRKPLVPHLLALEKVYRALLAGRGERGAVDFESVEARMMFNEQGRIDRIVRVVRNDAHKLIEECMLAANVCAASILEKHKHPALYRVHAGPTAAKLENLREFLGGLGLSLGGGDDPQAGDYARLAREVRERPDAILISSVMLRSMQQAQYSPDNIGHFGLAYERYAHFTSPIRRYPDLLVHRAIKAVLKRRTYVEDDWDALGAHCSKNERRADEASREVASWLKCMYAREHLGAEFDGAISGVAGFGLFVTMDDLLIDGMIHISELGKDYFKFDESRHVLFAERSGMSFRLGQRVRVKIVRADPDALKIDLQLVSADLSKLKPATDDESEGGSVTQEDRTVRRRRGKSGDKDDAGAKPAKRRAVKSGSRNG